jgi:2-keto-4-pentenoate hydratase/2-oxohepta-3-ene-1,7-dioic acid hydratase in catechol pathway
MRFVRFQHNGDAPRYGWLHEDQVGEIQGDLFGSYRRKKTTIPLKDVRLLAPTLPSKIVCVGRNYVDHAKELGNEVPKVPLIFLKAPSSVIADGEAVVLPPQSTQVEHEGELVAVIGKRGRNVTAESAKEYILGYTIGNDVTARDLQRRDGQWGRAKGFDTFCPLGPAIETELDPSGLSISCRVNGEIRQQGNTADMVFGVAELLAFISRVMTLLPGDVILTGTPAGIGPVRPGDRMAVEIERIGVLANPVVAGQ